MVRDDEEIPDAIAVAAHVEGDRTPADGSPPPHGRVILARTSYDTLCDRARASWWRTDGEFRQRARCDLPRA